MNEAAPQTDEENYDLEILEIFLEEGAELVETITGLYQDWRANITDLKIARELQRAYHTMKGGSRMAGVFRLGDFSFEMEHYYEKLANGTLAPSDAVFDLLERCHERTAQIIQQLTENNTCTRPTDLIEAIQQFGMAPVAEKAPVEEAPVVTEVPVAEEAAVIEESAAPDSLVSLFDDAVAAELGAESAEEITEELVVEEIPVAAEAFAAEDDSLVSLFDDAMAAEMVTEPTAAPTEEITEEPVIEEMPAVESVMEEVVAVAAAEEDGLASLFDDAMAAELSVESGATPEIFEEPVIEEALEKEGMASLFDDAMAAEMVAEPSVISEKEIEEIIKAAVSEEIPVAEPVVEETAAAEEDSLVSLFDDAMAAEMVAEPPVISEKEIEEIIEEPVIEEMLVVESVVEETAAAEEDSLGSLFDDAMAAEMIAEPTATPEEMKEIIEEPVIEEVPVVESVVEETAAAEEDSLGSLFDDAMAAEMIAEPTATPEEMKEIIEEPVIEEMPVVESEVEEKIIEGTPVPVAEEIIAVEEIKAEESLTLGSVPNEVMTTEPVSEPVEIIETTEVEVPVEPMAIVPDATSTEPVFELTATPSETPSLENEAVAAEALPEAEMPITVPETVDQEETAQFQFVVEESIQPTQPPVSADASFDKQVAEITISEEVSTFTSQEAATPTQEQQVQEIDIPASEKMQSNSDVVINTSEQAATTEKSSQWLGKVTSLLTSGLMVCWGVAKAVGRWITTYESNSPKQTQTDTVKLEAAQEVDTRESTTVIPQVDISQPVAATAEKDTDAVEEIIKNKRRGKNKRGNKVKEGKNKKNMEAVKTRKRKQPRKKK